MPRSFFAVWTWTIWEWFCRTTVLFGFLLVVFAIAYWNAYQKNVKIKREWYMKPGSRSAESMGYKGKPTYKPPGAVPQLISYQDWHRYSPVFFELAHQIDRRLRPSYWDRPAIDDP